MRRDGYLFLGTSENVNQFDYLFKSLERKHRIFQKIDQKQPDFRLPLKVNLNQLTVSTTDLAFPAHSSPIDGQLARSAIEARVFERFTPAFVAVTRNGQIVHYSANTGKYLQATAGVPTRNLLDLARKGLRLDLRNALREAIEQRSRVIRNNVNVFGDDGRTQTIDLIVEPIGDPGGNEPIFLIVFMDDGPVLEGVNTTTTLLTDNEEILRAIEGELRDTRERLQSLVEEYETALEELKSSNEELIAVNQEFQSANEELQASKEEMQSLNEELNTVNAELNIKVDALDAANSDLQNLFDSTQVATVFLDKDLKIRSYTPAVSGLFHILPGDRGRPITDLASRIALPTFTSDVATVLASNATFERRIAEGNNGASYLLRFAPYRNTHQQIDGVVVTFVDVTSLAKAELHQRLLIAELNHRVKNMLAVIISLATQSMKSAKTTDEYKKDLIDRLHAMARSYALLSRENWTETSFEELIRETLAPFGLERISLKGLPLNLKPEQTLSVGLILHELATNAVKHGALSVSSGHLFVAWEKSSGGKGHQVEVSWMERDGPEAGQPTRKGFGLKLVERETEHNLQGVTQFDFLEKGFEAKLRFPLDETERQYE